METRAHHVLIGLFSVLVVVGAMLFGLWLAFLVVSVALPTAGVMLPRLYGGRAATAALFFLLGALLWLTQPDAGP